MKLLELDPKWIHENVFVFKCPHCVAGGRAQPYWLSCKNVALSIHEQMDLFEKAMHDEVVVPMRQEVCWKISGKDFGTMTVEPSIDASPSGDWHGCIVAGEIR